MPASSRNAMSKPWLVRDNAGQVFRRSCDAEQKLLQLVQAVVGVGKAPRADAASRLIQDNDIMMGSGPVQSNVPQTCRSFSSQIPGGIGSLYNGWQTATSLQSSIGPGKLPGEARSFLIGQAVWRNKSFPGSADHAGLSLPAVGPKGL